MHSHRDCRQHSPQDITVLAGPASVGAEPAHAPHVEFQSPIARWIRWAWRSSSAGGRIGSGVMKAPSMPKAVQREENLAQASAPEEPDVRLVSEQPADDPDGMPLPSDLRFPGRLVLAGTPFSIYAAREIVLPIVLAFVLMLVLQPALRMLERLRVPRTLAALLLISLLFGTTSRSRLHCPGQLPPGQRSCPRACHGC
jgi:hypothetical protein